MLCHLTVLVYTKTCIHLGVGSWGVDIVVLLIHSIIRCNVFFLFLKHPMMAMERRKVNEKLLSGMDLKCNQSWFDYFSVLIYTVLRQHNFCPKKAGI